MSLSYAQLMNLSKKVDPKDLALMSKVKPEAKTKDGKSSAEEVTKEDQTKSLKKRKSGIPVESLSTARQSLSGHPTDTKRLKLESAVTSLKNERRPIEMMEKKAKVSLEQSCRMGDTKSSLISTISSSGSQSMMHRKILSTELLSTAIPRPSGLQRKSTGKEISHSSNSGHRLISYPSSSSKPSKVAKKEEPVIKTSLAKDGLKTIKSFSVSGGARKFVIPDMKSFHPSLVSSSSGMDVKKSMEPAKRTMDAKKPSIQSSSLSNPSRPAPSKQQDKVPQKETKKVQEKSELKKSSSRGFHINPYVDVNDPLLRGEQVNVSSYIGNLFGYNREKFVGDDDEDLSDMEADFATMRREELKSTRMAKKEDEEEERRLRALEKRRNKTR